MIMNMNDNSELSSLRVPPQANDSEMCVLGALLLNNNTMDLITGMLRPSDFYRHEHKVIFGVIASMLSVQKTADVVTVFETLERNNQDVEVGGRSYLNELAQFVPSPGNIQRYAEHVRDRSILRQLITVGDEIVANAYDTRGRDVKLILDAAEQKLFSIRERSAKVSEAMKPVSEELIQTLDTIQDRADNPDKAWGVLSGFKELDKLTCGFKPADLIILAGRPSMGKTSFAMNIVEHAALNQNLPVLVISLEMSRSQLVERMIGSVGRVNQTNMKTGNLTNDEWTRISEASEKLHNTNIEVQDIEAETIGQIRAAARRGAKKHNGLSLIVIDYLQLLDGDSDDHSENRTNEIAKISRGLKLLAKEMSCPIIALSQLNRGVESRGDKRPVMSDLRDSGALEQDADTVIFVYRDDYYTKDACKDPGVAEIIVSKQRNGALGPVRLAWQPMYTRFDNLAYQ
jgi:replicative DNA helicase